MRRIIKEEPWKTIINEEWRRAKKLRPVLHDVRKPRFFWDSMGHNKHGFCNYFTHNITLNEKLMGEEVSKQDFLNILRHEMAHIKSGRGHGEAFKNALNILGGTRWSTAPISRRIEFKTYSVTPPNFPDSRHRRVLSKSAKMKLEKLGYLVEEHIEK